MTLPAGTKLGRYEIRSQIGAGGMGEVYLAQDTKLDRKVALKILPGDLAANHDPMRRFVQEAKAASALNHPNIITIHEIEETDSDHFIATEFIDGLTLRARMQTLPLKLGESLDIAVQIASALSAAHAAGIVHRDIKPENIMLRRDGIVKVLDFGLAKLTEWTSPELVDTEAPTRAAIKTEPGAVMGTALYMSPEQARGLEMDARTDIFSLGVLIYEMVAGRLPFEGSNTNEILASILSDKEPSPLARYSREIPEELERIVSKALRKEREQRYQTTKDLLLDLQSLEHQLEFEARLKRSTPREPKAGAAVASEPGAIEIITKPVGSPTSKIGRIQSALALQRRDVIVAAAVVVVLAVVLGYPLLFRKAPATTNVSEIKSLAVLPLANLSGDPNQDYFADGMTEAVIAELSKISALRVISRTSVMQYKGTLKTMPEIARDLNVDAIVEGSIVRSGDRVGITVKLIHATKEEQPLWTESYQRDLRDILALQSEIGRAIATEIKVKLTPQERGLMTNARPVNPEAHEAYLKGLQFFNQGINERREDLLRKSFDYLEEAIKIQPDYGLAHAQLARSYHWLSWSSPEFYLKAKTEAIKALQIDETLAQAHSALGFTIFRLDWDWAGAEKEFKRAIELNPNYSEAHHAYALYLSAAGRHTEAIAEIRHAQELDPLTLPLKVNVGITYLHARQYDSAIEQFRNALDVNADNPGIHTCLGVAYVYKGSYEQGIAEFQKVIALSKSEPINQAAIGWVYALTGKAGVDPRKKANLAWAYAMSGKRDEAIKIVNELKPVSKQESLVSFSIASIYAAVGEKDQALEWLQKVYDDHAWVILWMNCYPEFDSLHANPRFADLARRVGLP